MSFYQYQKGIKEIIANTLNDRLDIFCYEVISRILNYIEEDNYSDLPAAEMELIKYLRKSIENYPVDWKLMGHLMNRIHQTIDRMIEDDLHELDNDLIEFLER